MKETQSKLNASNHDNKSSTSELMKQNEEMFQTISKLEADLSKSETARLELLATDRGNLRDNSRQAMEAVDDQYRAVAERNRIIESMKAAARNVGKIYNFVLAREEIARLYPVDDALAVAVGPGTRR